jgi:hypothetical protein
MTFVIRASEYSTLPVPAITASISRETSATRASLELRTVEPLLGQKLDEYLVTKGNIRVEIQSDRI